MVGPPDVGDRFFNPDTGGTTVPTVSLSFLNRGKVRAVCRVCREISELKTDQLCGRCVWIKSQISGRFAGAVQGTIAIPAQQHCKSLGCQCAACDGRTLDPHPLYIFDVGRADRRQIHFHPRCHDLWLEAVNRVPALKQDAAGQDAPQDNAAP
jgi:hypothetical protein